MNARVAKTLREYASTQRKRIEDVKSLFYATPSNKRFELLEGFKACSRFYWESRKDASIVNTNFTGEHNGSELHEMGEKRI